MNSKRQKYSLQLLKITAILILINWGSTFIYKRFDLTEDKRYTLSKTTLSILDKVNKPLYIDVFLEGSFPPEFKKLQNETKQLLEEFSAYNSNVIFQFANPLEEENKRDETLQKFFERGLLPLNVSVEEKGKQTQEMIFPWAVATYDKKNTKVALLKNLLGASTEDKIISSVQHLEFAFAEALHKITKEKKKKIAFLKGNGELEDRYIADFLKSIVESYHTAKFTLDSVATNPIATLKDLEKFDLAVVAKPTEPFTEAEKQVLDQYIVNGGKMLWLSDAVKADMDSLYNENGKMLAFPNELELEDFWFKYGIRVNPLLVKDERATPIKLATGEEGSQTQYEEYFWKFAPFVYPESNHPIVKNMDGVKFDFGNPIELLKNPIKKTVLLTSSKYSKPFGTPAEIALEMVTEETSEMDYKGFGPMPMAVLLEGKFSSLYQNRVVPVKDPNFKTINKTSKIIYIADGDVIKNQLDQDGYPLELGFDKWTKQFYGNKEFLLNCVNYLLDDNGLITIRTKDVNIPLLDKEKVAKNYVQTQMITLISPLVILSLFALLFNNLRKRKYQLKVK